MLKPLGFLGAGRQAIESAALAATLGYEPAFYYETGNFTVPGQEYRAEIIREQLALDSWIGSCPVVTAIGSPRLRRRFVRAWNGKYATLLAADAVLLGDVILGEDVTVAIGVRISNLVRVGNHVLVNIGATISHDTTVGDYVTISPGVNIAGVCNIGAGSFLGIGSCIIDHVDVGEGAVVAAGAVVTKDVEPMTLVAGVPARVVKKLEAWS